MQVIVQVEDAFRDDAGRRRRVIAAARNLGINLVDQGGGYLGGQAHGAGLDDLLEALRAIDGVAAVFTKPEDEPP